jgi:hypothetical protein
MAPKTKEETIELIRKGIAALEEQEPRVRKEILESEGWVNILFVPSQQLLDRLDNYFDWLEKKRQEIAYLIFMGLTGTSSIRSFQSYAAQHDLVIDGESDSWNMLMIYLHLPRGGRSIVVECKNQKSCITDQQFSRLCSIVQNKFKDTAHLGVFVSRQPATGFPKPGEIKRALKDARATQALYHSLTNKYVVVIDDKDLRAIKSGANFAKILEMKIREVEASSGVNLEFDENWEEVLLPPHLAKYN